MADPTTNNIKRSPQPLHISARSSQSLFQTSRSLPNPGFAIFFTLHHKGDFTFKEAWFHLYDEYPVKYEADRLPPPIVADLNGDGKKEVLVATNDAKIQEDFPHNAHHREIAISISNYTLKHGDTGLVIVGGPMEMQPNVCRRKKSSVGGRMEMQPMHIQWIYGDGDGDKYEDETVFRTFSCLSVVWYVNFGNSLCFLTMYY